MRSRTRSIAAAMVAAFGFIALCGVSAAAQTGRITGKVTDAVSGQPIPRASVLVEGTVIGAVTNDSGVYNITGAPLGARNLMARVLGYRKSSRPVTVTADGSPTVDFKLDQAPAELTGIVTTGTVVATDTKELTTTVTVVDADLVLARGATTTALMLKTVPGLQSYSFSYADYINYNHARGSSNASTAGIKTYIDGVEMTDPYYTNFIDPSSIDHIEVITGPQASTLYGAEATNGVVQIFTKRGQLGLAPQWDLKASAGELTSKYNYDRGWVPVTDNTIQMMGGGKEVSYNFGFTYNYVGDWAQDNLETWHPPYGNSIHLTRSEFGGLRMQQGSVVLDVTLRNYNRGFGYPYLRVLTDSVRSGRFSNPSLATYKTPYGKVEEIGQQTYGFNAKWLTTPTWRNELQFGVDYQHFNYYDTKPHYLTPADTLLFVYDGFWNKPSLKFNSIYETELGNDFKLSGLAGVDHYKYSVITTYTYGAIANVSSKLNTVNDPRDSYSKTEYNNQGEYGQLKLGWKDHLFTEAGLRADQNSNYGADYKSSYSPRFAMSYVSEPASWLELKLRSAWGKTISPPPLLARTGLTAPTYAYLPNPSIGPYKVSGPEFGADFYVGKNYSLQATYYDQKSDDIVYAVYLTAPGVVPALYQYQNVGTVSNKGWELAGRADVGPVRLNATYSPVNSKIVKLSNTTGIAQGFVLGASPILTPKSSASLTATYYPNNKMTLTLGANYSGSWWYYDLSAYYRALYSTNAPAFKGYVTDFYWWQPAVTKILASGTWQLSTSYQFFFDVQNLLNNYQGDGTYTIDMVYGRRIELGFRAHR